MRRLASCCMLLVATATCPVLAAADQGITSETHRKNIGRIVWAKERLRMDAQDRIALQTSFKYGEPIYGRVYLSKSLAVLAREQSCPNSTLAFRLNAFVDGVDKGVINRNAFESEDWTTVQVTLRLTPGDEKDRMNIGLPEAWDAIAASLPAGSHKVRVEFYSLGSEKGCALKLASGEFTFEKTDKAVGPAGLKLPEPLMRNTKLEAEMVRAVKDRGWKNEEPVKVVIVERDWRMIRDPFGTITHREINTHVVLRKLADGSLRANDISFRQEARPGNAWGPTEVYGIGTRSYPVDPKELK
jgi:hypothetical protein